MTDHDDQFLSAIWSEKLAAQERRQSLINRKLTWLTGLLAVGSIELPLEFDAAILLYLVPAIAIVFDLYILGENYGIKRMGIYVRIHFTDRADGKWEQWLRKKRDPHSRLALPLSTLIVTLGAGTLLWFNAGTTIGLLIWIGLSLSLVCVVDTLASRQLKTLDLLGGEQPCEDGN